MTTLLHLPLGQVKISLWADTPLSFLGQVFPDGIPCAPWMLCLDGHDCYEFNPDDLPDEQLIYQVADAIASEAYPRDLLHGLFRYGHVLIPIEWVETPS